MIVPSKFTPLDKTILAKLPLLADSFDDDISPSTLFDMNSKHFEDIGEYILALDTLYILEIISFDRSRGLICRC